MSCVVICKPIQAAEKYLSATSRNVFLKDKHGFKLTIICVVENSNACLVMEEDVSKGEIKAGELFLQPFCLLLGLNPLTTGQAGGRCSAEALSSHFSTGGAKWDLPGLQLSKTAYKPGPAEARSVVLVETTLLTKQSIKKKSCFVGNSGDRSGLTAAEFVGVV